MGMGDVSAGWAAKYRPNSPTAEKLMKELLCDCGCARQSIFECDCGHAAELRQQVLEMLAAKDASGKPLYDLSTSDGRQHAYDAVAAAFAQEYGGNILATPKSQVTWLLPSLAALGGLALIGGIGRRWLAAARARSRCREPVARGRCLRRQAGRRARGDGLRLVMTPILVVWLRRVGAGLVLALGWLFILWANNFHLDAPVVFACLGHFAVIAIVYNLWRAGAAVAAPPPTSVEDDAWARPLGARGDLEKEKRSLLKAIKEAEFDREMGKLSQADADGMIRTYRARAIEVLKELERLDAGEAGSVRERIEREVQARLEVDARGSRAAGKKKDKKPAQQAAKAEPKTGAKTRNGRAGAGGRGDRERDARGRGRAAGRRFEGGDAMKRLLAAAAFALGTIALVTPASAQIADAFGRPLPSPDMAPGSVSVLVIAGVDRQAGREHRGHAHRQRHAARRAHGLRAATRSSRTCRRARRSRPPSRTRTAGVTSQPFTLPGDSGVQVHPDDPAVRIPAAAAAPFAPFAGGAGKMPEPRQMSGQGRGEQKDQPGTLTVRLTYDDFKDAAPVGVPVTVVGYHADQTIDVHTLLSDKDGRAQFTNLDRTGATRTSRWRSCRATARSTGSTASR